MDGTRDYQQMAVGILAIATAALGFGLWNQDFDLALLEAGSRWLNFLAFAQIIFGVIAAICYFGTFVMVGRILGQKGRVTGQDLLTRPMVWLYLQMFALVVLFLVGYFADIAVAGQNAPGPPTIIAGFSGE